MTIEGDDGGIMQEWANQSLPRSKERGPIECGPPLNRTPLCEQCGQAFVVDAEAGLPMYCPKCEDYNEWKAEEKHP